MRRILLVLAVAAMMATALPSVAWASGTDGGFGCWFWCPPPPPPPPSDTTTPIVIDTTPDDDATRVNRGRSITAKFSEVINPATLDGSSFTLVQEGSTTPVEAVVSYDESSQTVKLNPKGRLAKYTNYTAKIEGAGDEDNLAAKDLSGIALAQAFVWSFTTGRK
jgi:hypothetical protein